MLIYGRTNLYKNSFLKYNWKAGMRLRQILHFMLFICFLFQSRQVEAQESYETNSNVQLLYGRDLDNAAKGLATITLEHFGAYGALEHFGFADIYNNINLESPDLYVEWYPKVSVMPGRGNKIGPLSDILLGSGINVLFGGEGDFFVYLAGPVWKFDITGIDLFQLETYYYRQVGEEFDGTYQITPSWDIPLPLTDRYRLRTRGFIDFIGDRGPGTTQLVTHPQLLLDIGNLLYRPGGIYFGTEWRYWRNVLGVKGVSESIIQTNLLIHF